VIWLVRIDTLDGKLGMLRPDAAPKPVTFELREMQNGTYRVTPWDTREGTLGAPLAAESRDGVLSVTVGGLATDLALAIRLQ
jgi:hypothetical protein